MARTSIWIPPSLCGCQLQITADWANSDDIVNGVTYRHPTPFSITDIKIIGNACATHQPFTQSMIDTSIFFDDPEATPIGAYLSKLYPVDVRTETVQQRGYLKYPIDQPTAAHFLYTFLSQYNGQAWSIPCGCKTYQFFDENKNGVCLNHPIHSVKCTFHPNDTLDMQQAVLDWAAYNKTP